MKKIKLLSLMGLFTLASSTGIVLSTSLNNLVVENQSTKIETITNTVEESYPIEKAQSNGQNSFLSTPTGPLVYWNNVITSLDWFGAERWTIDMAEITGIKNYHDYSSWKRSWFNWDYDRTRNILWVLGYGDVWNSNVQQTLYSFDGITGKQLGSYPLSKKKTDYRFMSALVSGNVLVYGGAGSGYDAKVELLEVGSKSLKEVQGNSREGLTLPPSYQSTSKWYFYNLIPISNNKNIVQLMNFPTKSSTGDGGASHASYQVDFILVDDKMNFISRDPNNIWSKQHTVIENGVPGFRNSTITPQRDYYFLLDGRVVTVIYNTVVIIDPKSNNSANSNVSYNKYNLDSSKWVLSWSFDTNENLFFKYKNDMKIYRVKASELKNTSTAVSPATYFDIASAGNDISKYANNYILYNVYGYRGQIVLINAWYSDYIRNNDAPNEQEIKEKEYGLQVAITENKSSQESGDSLGVLNGPKSFQQSADFQIDQQILNNKLPSEITRNDLTLLNGGFITSNPKRDEKGNLLYKPFDLLNINDQNGTFDITVNLDQIPWFASTLPTDSIPKKITKKYTNGQHISKKVSWNDNLSYDLKNTLPSKVTLDDLKAFNPFQVSFNSRTVLDSSGNVQYPKTTYSISSSDDNTGKLVVNAKYDYMPVSQEVNTPQTYSSNTTYTLFKSGDTKGFYFAGSNSEASSGSSSSIDVKSVPQLKELSESNLLPSSFANQSNQNSFLQFINTNKSTGYPISKMNFEFEPDDLNGTLTVKATMPSSYYGKEEVFRQTYTGLNKKTEYKFSFSDVQRIDGSSISIMLPSSISEGDIISTFIQYSGFNSNDFEIILIPNNENGTLTVQVKLDKSYPSEIGNANPFSNYLATRTYSGFMTTESFNNQYQVSFKDNSNASLVELKKLTIQSIDESLTNKNSSPNNNGLTINSVTYTSWDDLAERLLVESKGSKIPGEWKALKDKNQLETKVSYNNESGTLNISVKIKKEALNGYQSDLNFVQSYDGFAKGNKVITDDSLSFISNDLLKTTVEQVKDMNAIEMKNWLDENKQNINHLILSKTGQYVDLIENGGFQLETSVNETYNTISIKIVFENLTNGASLKEYSIQYTL